MNGKQILLSILTLDFLAATIWAVAEMGGLGNTFAVVTTNAATMLLTFDLLIALGIGTGWMVVDAKKRGWNPWPYVALTLGTGSAGLLLYLVRRVGDPKPVHAMAAA